MWRKRVSIQKLTHLHCHTDGNACRCCLVFSCHCAEICTQLDHGFSFDKCQWWKSDHSIHLLMVFNETDDRNIIHLKCIGRPRFKVNVYSILLVYFCSVRVVLWRNTGHVFIDVPHWFVQYVYVDACSFANNTLNKKAVLSQRRPRNAPYRCPENFWDSLTTPTALCQLCFCSDQPSECSYKIWSP